MTLQVIVCVSFFPKNFFLRLFLLLSCHLRTQTQLFFEDEWLIFINLLMIEKVMTVSCGASISIWSDASNRGIGTEQNEAG